MTELMFNIEILLNTPATAVRCSTEEEAQQDTLPLIQE